MFLLLLTEALDCGYCEGIEKIPYLQVESKDVVEMIELSEPFVLTDVENYADKNVTFNDLKLMFARNKADLDEATCSIKHADQYGKISDYFEQLDEEAVMERNISIEWYVTIDYLKTFRDKRKWVLTI